jgi:flavin-dependent dehydrogenase
MRRDPLIIGGGPAGTAAAITLARFGHHPLLLEKTTRPTDKVCGDFLSHDAIRQVQCLGIDPATLGAAPINRVRLVRGNRVAEAALPFPAIGLSRRILDAALLRAAEATGAIVCTGQTVRRLTRDGGTWSVQTDTLRTAGTVFLATGKHDLRNAPRTHTTRDAVGMKTYLALAPGPARILRNATELTLFPGGYAGMQHVEDGQTVLCIAVRRAAFHAYGGTWPSLLTSVRRSSPRFTALLDGARALLLRPLAVAAIPYGYCAEPGDLFRLGDQAAVIPSLTGDGIAIALHSGQQAAESWLAGLSPQDYQRALTRTLSPQMRLAGLLHWGGTNHLAQTAAHPVLRRFPNLLRWAAGRTRLPQFTAARSPSG